MGVPFVFLISQKILMLKVLCQAHGGNKHVFVILFCFDLEAQISSPAPNK